MASKKEMLKGGINSLFSSKAQDAEYSSPLLNNPTQDEEEIIEMAKAKKASGKNVGGRPKSNFRKVEKASQEGCKENETRATFIVKESLLEQFKQIAYWKRLKVKDAADLMLSEFVEKYASEIEEE